MTKKRRYLLSHLVQGIFYFVRELSRNSFTPSQTLLSKSQNGYSKPRYIFFPSFISPRITTCICFNPTSARGISLTSGGLILTGVGIPATLFNLPENILNLQHRVTGFGKVISGFFINNSGTNL